MIKKISQKAACSLCCVLNKGDAELYEYAVYIVLSAIWHFVTVIAIGFVFGLPIESAIFYLSFSLIRKFAGGYHAQTPTICFVFSVLVISAGLMFMKLLFYVDSQTAFYLLFIPLFLSFIAVCAFAPQASANNPLSKSEKRVYRKLAILFALIILAASAVLIILNCRNVGVPMAFGLFMSSVVLVMRKYQIKKEF